MSMRGGARGAGGTAATTSPSVASGRGPPGPTRRSRSAAAPGARRRSTDPSPQPFQRRIAVRLLRRGGRREARTAAGRRAARARQRVGARLVRRRPRSPLRPSPCPGSAQNGGQGMAGRSGSGRGKRPVASSASTLAAVAAHLAARRGAGAAPGRARRPARRAGARARRARPACEVLAAPAPRGRSGASARRRSRSRGRRRRRGRRLGRMWPTLRSALLTTASKTAIDRSAGSERCDELPRVDRLVGVDPQLDHALAERARRAGPSAGRSPSRSPRTRCGRPPRGGRACRPGSRRAGARRGSACRRRSRRGPAPGPGARQGDRAVHREVGRCDEPAEDLELALAEQRRARWRGRWRPAGGRRRPRRSSAGRPCRASGSSMASVSSGTRSCGGRCGRAGRAAGHTAGRAADRRRRRGSPGRRSPARWPGGGRPGSGRARPRRRRVVGGIDSFAGLVGLGDLAGLDDDPLVARRPR